MNTSYSLIHSYKTMLRSQQREVQDISEIIDFHRANGISERGIFPLEVERLQKNQVADEMAVEKARMEAEDPIHWKRSCLMEKRLREVHMLLAERGIYDTYHAAVTIQLLSGETISIGIHMDQEMRTLPYAFVAQLEYHPSIIDRLFFMDFMGQSILLSKTWKEYYGAAEEIPTLYLYIYPESEKDKEEKIQLIHDILKKQKRHSLLSDHDLWSLYTSWNKTYLPTTTYHRYTKLQEFVLTHPSVFVSAPSGADPMDQLVKQWIQLREKNSRTIRERMTQAEFRHNREIAWINLHQVLMMYPYFSLLDESEETQHNRIVLRHYFSIQELIELGMRPQNISTDWWIAEWPFWSSMAARLSA